MDHSNLNKRKHRWLEVVKDYDYKILYHPRKANMVVDVMSHKVMSAPIWDLCLAMTIVTPLLEHIHEAQVEAMKEEH